MNLKEKIIKTVAVMLSLVCFITFIPGMSILTGAKSVSSMQNEINDLEKKSKDLEKKIKELESSKADQQELAKLYKEKAANTKAELDAVVSEISKLESDIKAKENEISQKEIELQNTVTLFEKRLKAIYMTGSTSQLELLLSADNLSDYLARSELMRNVTEADNALMDTIKKNMSEIEAAKQAIVEKKASADSRKDELKALNTRYTNDLAKINSTIADINDTTDELEDDLEKYQAAIDKLNDEIKKATEEAVKSNPDIKFTSGIFSWPLPNCYTISSYFGQRWGKLHKGIDISKSGIYGSPIKAAADGVVIIRKNDQYGYGNYVMIYHGTKDGTPYSTLYGHMSAPASVSLGQTVKAGQTIGYVGSTGRSSGPHLHFEIRIGSGIYAEAVNPLNYFK